MLLHGLKAGDYLDIEVTVPQAKSMWQRYFYVFTRFRVAGNSGFVLWEKSGRFIQRRKGARGSPGTFLASRIGENELRVEVGDEFALELRDHIFEN